MLLSIENLTIYYGRTRIVDDISFELKRGEILAIVGASGSGKSTVLKSINGLLGRNARIEGRIVFDGREITRLDSERRREISGRSIAMIFQNAAASFCPIRTIGDQIFEAVRSHGDWSREQFQRRAERIMEKINLAPHVLDEYPFRLSGGMAQRAGILAAMILNPKLLLADEPTSALDSVTQVDVVKELAELRRRDGISMILVTHNLSVAKFLADKILIMKHGRAVDFF